MDRRVRRVRRRSPFPILISLLIIVAAVGVATYYFQRHAPTSDEMDLATYYGLTSDEQAALVVDDTILEEKGLTRNGVIYVAYETVYHYFNSGFYWENATRTLRLTSPSGTVSWTAEDGSGDLLVEGGLPYISAECIRDNSDIDLEIFSEPQRIVARTSWTDLSAMKVNESGEVRYRGGPKSEVLTSVRPGDIVVLLERLDDWYKVSTKDGFLGYIESTKVAEAPAGTISHTSDPWFEFPHIFAEEKICLAWQYVSENGGNDELETLTAGAAGLNVVCPTWFSFADAEGTLVSHADASYVERAHAAGLDVWPSLRDEMGKDDLGTLLATGEKRAFITEQLLQAAADTGVDGINIDLETLQEEEAPHYLQFLKEFCVAAHERGLIVSTDNYVPMYTRHYNHAEQARTVDYIVIMGYDEHTSGSAEAGSVASLPFVEQGITDMLEMVPAEQIVIAMPFYTRGWQTDPAGQNLTFEVYGMQSQYDFIEAHGIQLAWDPEVGQNVGMAQDEDGIYSIWAEDLQSTEERLKLFKKYGLAGVGAWRLGFEDARVWPLIESYLES